MRAIRKTDQGGSVRVIGVVIIGFILAVVVFGSIYYVMQRGRQAQIEQVATEQSSEVSTEKTVESTTVHTSSNSTDSAVKGASTTDILPHTGPESTVVNLVGVFLLTVSVFGYFSSKRYIPRSL